MLGRTRFHQSLIDLEVDVKRQQGIKNFHRRWLELVIFAWVNSTGNDRKTNSLEFLCFANRLRAEREKLDDRRFLIHHRHKVVEGDRNLVVVTVQKLFGEEAGDRTSFGERNRVLDFEVGDHFLAQLRKNRAELFAYGDVMCLVATLAANFFEQVRIESAAETFVGRYHQHQLALALTGLQQGVRFFLKIGFEVDEHFIELIGVIASRNRLVLRLLHLRRSNELHGASDLGSVLDRFDASANVAKVGHVLGEVGSDQ